MNKNKIIHYIRQRTYIHLFYTSMRSLWIVVLNCIASNEKGTNDFMSKMKWDESKRQRITKTKKNASSLVEVPSYILLMLRLDVHMRTCLPVIMIMEHYCRRCYISQSCWYLGAFPGKEVTFPSCFRKVKDIKQMVFHVSISPQILLLTCRAGYNVK